MVYENVVGHAGHCQSRWNGSDGGIPQGLDEGVVVRAAR